MGRRVLNMKRMDGWRVGVFVGSFSVFGLGRNTDGRDEVDQVIDSVESGG